MNILIIEDDVKIANSISEVLNEQGFHCQHATHVALGKELALSGQFQLIITDLMLPDGDGLSIISELRSQNIQIPVLILSAKRSLDDRVLGLQQGGDDYMVKPFEMIELVARVNNLLKRSNPVSVQLTQIVFEDMKMNLLSREVFREGKKLDLQAKEFMLLEYFMKNPNKPLSKNQILEKIWGYSFDPQTNVVDVLVYRLRSKVDKDFNKAYLHTLRGIGYVLKLE